MIIRMLHLLWNIWDLAYRLIIGRVNRNSDEKERRRAIKDFYEKQNNRRSSIASGIHISSKLWELGLGIMRVPR